MRRLLLILSVLIGFSIFSFTSPPPEEVCRWKTDTCLVIILQYEGFWEMIIRCDNGYRDEIIQEGIWGFCPE